MCFTLANGVTSCFQKYNIANTVLLITQLRESLCNRHQQKVGSLHFAVLNPAYRTPEPLFISTTSLNDPAGRCKY